jgi:hypothetical protein
MNSRAMRDTLAQEGAVVSSDAQNDTSESEVCGITNQTSSSNDDKIFNPEKEIS